MCVCVFTHCHNDSTGGGVNYKYNFEKIAISNLKFSNEVCIYIYIYRYI